MLGFSLFVFGSILVVLAIHPFVSYPLSLRFLSKMRGSVSLRQNSPQPSSYAVCVCAYNEQGVIGSKIDNLLALRQALGGALDIHVYVDAATDQTVDILRGYGSQIDVVVGATRQGKSVGMNTLVARARADILIFTDANVFFDVESIRNLARYFRDASVGCVCGYLRYVNEADSATAMSGSLYWRLEEYIKQAESDTGSIMGADGSIFAIRRSLRPVVPADIIDDFYVSMSILLKGHRVVRAPDVVAYEKSVPVSTDEFQRKVRITCRAFNAHRALIDGLRTLPPLDLYKYVSHKFLRWFAIYFLLLGSVFLCVGEFLWVGSTWMWVSYLFVFWAWFIGLKLRIKVFMLAAQILLAFVATGMGVLASLRGQRFQTWNPALSIRDEGILVRREAENKGGFPFS